MKLVELQKIFTLHILMAVILAFAIAILTPDTPSKNAKWNRIGELYRGGRGGECYNSFN